MKLLVLKSWSELRNNDGMMEMDAEQCDSSLSAAPALCAPVMNAEKSAKSLKPDAGTTSCIVQFDGLFDGRPVSSHENTLLHPGI